MLLWCLGLLACVWGCGCLLSLCCVVCCVITFWLLVGGVHWVFGFWFYFVYLRVSMCCCCDGFFGGYVV